MVEPQVVVTGARGFLGSAVVAWLRNAGVNVVTVSRSVAGADVQVADYRDAPKGDVLIHLAEDNDIARVNERGDGYVEDMLATLAHLLGLGYRRVLYASSAVLYGDFDTKAHSEEDPIRIHNAYTRLKQASEAMTLAGGVHAAVRLSNLYGPGMSPGNVISAILDQVGKTGPLVVRDDTSVRDFLWVEDAASAMGRIALGKDAGLYNLGTGLGTSVRSLAESVLALTGESQRQILATARARTPSTLVVDSGKAAAVWGWRPATELASGLRRLLIARGALAPS